MKPLTPLHVAAADAESEALELLARLGLALQGYPEELDATDKNWLLAAVELAIEKRNPSAFIETINGKRPKHRLPEPLTAEYARPARMYFMLLEMGRSDAKAKGEAEAAFDLSRRQLNYRIRRCREESPQTEEHMRELARRLIGKPDKK